MSVSIHNTLSRRAAAGRTGRPRQRAPYVSICSHSPLGLVSRCKREAARWHLTFERAVQIPAPLHSLHSLLSPLALVLADARPPALLAFAPDARARADACLGSPPPPHSLHLLRGRWRAYAALPCRTTKPAVPCPIDPGPGCATEDSTWRLRDHLVRLRYRQVLTQAPRNDPIFCSWQLLATSLYGKTGP